MPRQPAPPSSISVRTRRPAKKVSGSRPIRGRAGSPTFASTGRKGRRSTAPGDRAISRKSAAPSAVGEPRSEPTRSSIFTTLPVRSSGGRSQDQAASRRGSAAPVALKHEADRRIRIGAEILAGRVEHVVLGVGAVPLLRKRARSGAGDQNESNGGLHQHDYLLSSGRSHLAG